MLLTLYQVFKCHTLVGYFILLHINYIFYSLLPRQDSFNICNLKYFLGFKYLSIKLYITNYKVIKQINKFLKKFFDSLY